MCERRLHLHVTTSLMGPKTPLGHQFYRLSRICLTLLSLTAQRVGGAEKPFILGRHNMQWKRNREAHGMCVWGGCHLCEGTSKDSSADVSKQDGCQVSSVNYLGNKNWLMFMRHAPVPKTALCFFNTAGSCFLPWSVNFLCAFCLFFNQMDWIFVPFDHTECQRGIFLLWAAGKLMTTLCFLSSHRQMKGKIFFKKPMALFFCLSVSCHPLFQRRKHQGIIIYVWYVWSLKAWQD